MTLTQKPALLLILLLSLPALWAAGSAEEATDTQVPDNLGYKIVDKNSVTITSYYGDAPTLVIPSRINNLPVTAIGKSAFRGYGSLTNVTIPPTVTDIGDWAFNACGNLASLAIPSSVTIIGNYVFSRCNNLTNITTDSNNPVYASVEGVLFDKDVQNLIQYPAGRKTESYAIPSSVTAIKDAAFYGCKMLTSVTIPSSITAIDAWAFSGCSSLKTVTIPSSVKTIGDWAFWNCGNLTSVNISRQTKLKSGAFPTTTQIVYQD